MGHAQQRGSRFLRVHTEEIAVLTAILIQLLSLLLLVLGKLGQSLRALRLMHHRARAFFIENRMLLLVHWRLPRLWLLQVG